MGGKGSGRPRGPETERILIVYQSKREKYCFSVYVPVEAYDVIEEYCLAKGWCRASYAKRLIEKYFRTYQPITIGDSMPYVIWYGFRNSDGKDMSRYLWKIIKRELTKDEDFQEFKQEVI